MTRVSLCRTSRPLGCFFLQKSLADRAARVELMLRQRPKKLQIYKSCRRASKEKRDAFSGDTGKNDRILGAHVANDKRCTCFLGL